ncbi:MAG: hypothetical protein PVJ85_14605, partial [Anaerolineae bacterium]|jgi:hypothetical protein
VTFYWPHLKALINGLLDAGLISCPFFEGTYDQRLEYLTELPPGKVMGSLVQTVAEMAIYKGGSETRPFVVLAEKAGAYTHDD